MPTVLLDCRDAPWRVSTGFHDLLKTGVANPDLVKHLNYMVLDSTSLISTASRFSSWVLSAALLWGGAAQAQIEFRL